jgi:hypothetical protein
MASTIMDAGTVDNASESRLSAVSWAAVLAGAFVTISVGLMLLALGAGVGFSSISPWSGSGVSATTFTVAMAIWLIVVQWLSSALGAYVTGRLRTKWVGLHSDEVTFRDTAHGLLTWSVAAVIGALLLGSAVTSLIGGASGVAATAAGSAAGASDPNAYFVDSLYRGTPNAQTAAGAGDPRAEATRIFAVSLKNGAISPADKTYLAQSIAARTGLSQPDAEKRIDDVVNEAKAAADTARKNAAKTATYTFFSMLIGAFIAAAAGALGGRARDA